MVKSKQEKILLIEIEELKLWLEWAGKNLLSMPIRSPAPSAPGVAWPDYSSDPNVAYAWDTVKLRAAPPDKDQIKFVDEILELIHLVQDTQIRRILQTRTLVSPINGNYIYSFSRIGQLLHTSAKQVSYKHKKGLEIISSSVTEEKAIKLKKFFSTINLN